MTHPTEIQLVQRGSNGDILPTQAYRDLTEHPDAPLSPAQIRALSEQVARQTQELEMR